MHIEVVNGLDEAAFVAAFGHVYEHTPALARAAFAFRPFAGRDELITAFAKVAGGLDSAAQLALLRAHPQLATGGPMGETSSAEQRSAGLTGDGDGDGHTDMCGSAGRPGGERLAAIRSGNEQYAERFGFPFIIAVRGLGPAGIAAALAERLEHDPDDERAEALRQVQRIATLRIEQEVDA